MLKNHWGVKQSLGVKKILGNRDVGSFQNMGALVWRDTQVLKNHWGVKKSLGC